MSSLQIPLAHYTDQDFMNAFRADLVNSNEQVIILSPFVSKNRASNYYNVLRSLTSRNVAVEVYTKPKSEQPVSLREHFDNVERSLEKAGVKFLVRSGMHEKIGFIDNRILWHGSLNMLSHNDTRHDFEDPSTKGQRTKIENQLKMHQHRMRERRNEVETMHLGAFPAPELLNMVIVTPA